MYAALSAPPLIFFAVIPHFLKYFLRGTVLLFILHPLMHQEWDLPEDEEKKYFFSD